MMTAIKHAWPVLLLLTLLATACGGSAPRANPSNESAWQDVQNAAFHYETTGALQTSSEAGSWAITMQQNGRYALTLTGSGAQTTHRLMLVLPADPGPGEYAIGAANNQNTVTASFTHLPANGLRATYQATSGTLTLATGENGQLSGSFTFTASAEGMEPLTVQGDFSGLALLE